MSKISETNYGTDIVYGYNIKSVNNREQALEWIAQVVMMNEVDVHTIEMKDFLSYHDGSQTKMIDRFASITDFVNEYIDSDYIGVGVSGLLDGISFDLGINLDTQKIVLVLSADVAIHLKKIELLLGLD